jgi:hypothetical protein
MAKLAAELLDAELLILDDHKIPLPNRLQQLRFMLSSRNPQSDDSCMLICPSAPNMAHAIYVDELKKKFKFVSAWVIDSFWVDRIPLIAKYTRTFDHVFITSAEDIEAWEKVTKTPTTWLPWGSDVLRLGGINAERPWDITRIGRQPSEWEDDVITQKMCAETDLTFHGRLSFVDTHPLDNQKNLMELYKKSKYLVAFSTKASPGGYTHPIRQYLTARWTDSLACGTTVAGIAPREPSIDNLLWSGATLELGTTNLKQGLAIIAEAKKDWTKEKAEHNYKMALQRLDWRLRFVEIAKAHSLSPHKLYEEIAEIKLLAEAVK